MHPLRLLDPDTRRPSLSTIRSTHIHLSVGSENHDPRPSYQGASLIPYKLKTWNDSARTSNSPKSTQTKWTQQRKPGAVPHRVDVEWELGYQLSDGTMNDLNRALNDGIARSTSKKYSSAVRRFLQFCDTEGIPEEDRLPAPEVVLCAFAARGVGKQAESTIRNALTGVRSWHIAEGCDWHGGPRLARIIRGVKMSAPQTSTRPQRAPFTATFLATLVLELDLSDPFDAAVAAISGTALWGLARLGELIPDSSFSADTSRFPTGADLGPLSTTRKSRTLRLPYTKTTQVDGGKIILTNQSGLANPLPLIENHLEINHPSRSDLLFAFRGKDQKSSVISKKSFLQWCNDVLEKKGYGRITGHCFRIGGTYEMLKAGVALEVVQKLGRWKSDAFLRYWREEQEIGELHISESTFRT
ncbi:hypothetical protein FRC04_004927 [Tulasnella sp. 424]|nr:hypothetical protein FRC04_004927 [Tulasnella sp. 424]